MEALQANPALFLSQFTKQKDNGGADALAALLDKASLAYTRGEPLIDDTVFDIALEHLRSIAPKHEFLQRVGAPEVDRKVVLPYWMGSLDKIKDAGEKAIAKFKETYPGKYVVSHKLDGISGLLVYNEGTALKLYSRGDGTEGQDLSGMLKYIDVPASLPTSSKKSTIAVRGELIISKRNWAAISDKGSNARNMVAGTTHAKQPDADVARRIDFVVYELLEPKMPFSDGLEFMKNAGFNVVQWSPVPAKDLTVEALSDILVRERDSSEYEIDGIVITQDTNHKIIKGKNPKYAFAFKSILTQTEAEVLVSGVEWRVSKDGYIKPTVVFPPVNLAGVNIQRATGNNAAFIVKHGIGVGARIVIIRSGDVIPKVIRVTKPTQPMMPDIPWKWNETHVDIMVDGDGVSAEQKIRNLEYFMKRLEVKHVAIGTLTRLAEAGYDTVAALLNMSVTDVAAIDGFKKTSATTVVNAIQTIRKKPCVDIMIASNLFGRGLGDKKIRLIVNALPKVIEGHVPTLTELEEIEGIGNVTAKSFLAGLSAFFAFMDDIGITCAPPVAAAVAAVAVPVRTSPGAMKDQVVVFTGFRDKAWEAAVAAAGGKVAGTVSGKTTLVVAAEINGSSKIAKAHELGIKVLTKTEFGQHIKKYL